MNQQPASALRGIGHFLPEAFSRATASHGRAAGWLVLISLLLFLPGFFSLQPMDRDEPRFAQATKQMLETGDFVAIRFQDTARNKKPVGIYWAQAAAVSAGAALGIPEARTRIWLYRLPSLAGALAAVLLTYWAALAFAGRAAALAAALLLGSTILLSVEARLAKTDAVVLATVIAAMGAFARIYLGQGDPSRRGWQAWRLPAIFWTAVGIGLLVKGPITPMVPLLTGFALAVRDRATPWLGRLRPVTGILWALLLVAPWFALIMIETKGAFLRDSLGGDMLAKVGSGKESHGAPPLTYFAAFWATAWPIAPLAAIAAPFVWMARGDRAAGFLLAWIVPFWVVFELVPTKLPHYVLPVYPGIAILIAMASEQDALEPASRWRRAVLWLVPLVTAILVAAGVGLAIWLGDWPGIAFYIYGPIAIAAAVAFALPGWPAESRIAAAVLAALALYPAVYSGILSSNVARPVAISPRLAATAQALGAIGCREPQLASAGYYEPSLVFLTRTDIKMTFGKQAGQFLAASPAGASPAGAGAACRVAFVEKRQEADFRAAIAGATGIREVGRVTGININGGRPLDIGVWMRPGGAR